MLCLMTCWKFMFFTFECITKMPSKLSPQISYLGILLQGGPMLTALPKMSPNFTTKHFHEKFVVAVDTWINTLFDPRLRVYYLSLLLSNQHIKRNFLNFYWSNSIFSPNFQSEPLSLWDCVCLQNKIAQSSFFALL